MPGLLVFGTPSTSVGERALLWCWCLGLLKVEVIAAEVCDKISLKYADWRSIFFASGYLLLELKTTSLVLKPAEVFEPLVCFYFGFLGVVETSLVSFHHCPDATTCIDERTYEATMYTGAIVQWPSRYWVSYIWENQVDQRKDKKLLVE